MPEQCLPILVRQLLLQVFYLQFLTLPGHSIKKAVENGREEVFTVRGSDLDAS